jgi:hypothetical protein
MRIDLRTCYANYMCVYLNLLLEECSPKPQKYISNENLNASKGTPRSKSKNIRNQKPILIHRPSGWISMGWIADPNRDKTAPTGWFH